ncbi:hypothetical protein SJAV_08880 [Sulfurisphaera javensis]|uniref:Uncharacterized protein n=1 Tax=Sulfurisphaera javensis TaxID=2049879 RepID=A0AAT9GQI8_9CREN
MPSEVVSEMMLIVLVIIVGTVILGFSFAYLLPQIAFSNAQNQASNLASSSSVSVGPLLLSSSGNSGSLVVELFNPAYNGTLYVYAFVTPSYEESSAGIITPTSPSSFSVYFPNGSTAPSYSVSTIYETNGKILYGSGLTVYKVTFNTPITIVVNNVNKNDIVIIWFIVNEGGYYFRIGYTYTGVPTT